MVYVGNPKKGPSGFSNASPPTPQPLGGAEVALRLFPLIFLPKSQPSAGSGSPNPPNRTNRTPRQSMGSPVQSPSCPGITYPSTKPCFLAWRRRYASYFSPCSQGPCCHGMHQQSRRCCQGWCQCRPTSPERRSSLRIQRRTERSYPPGRRCRQLHPDAPAMIPCAQLHAISHGDLW